GKHNDLEEVGVDTYHHTMFEMLGNWSFNDYFKIDAIKFAWKLLTDVYSLPKEKLYVTVFEGSENENIPASTIALKEWQQYVLPDHIVFGNKKDNFWEMGDTGPCGPCSEIHIDLRSDEEIKKISGRELVNKDHPQVIEIWNLVFIQYNRKKDSSLEKLPSFHVDTGMGLERLVRAIQQKTSNYDTDIFMPTIKWVENKTGLKYDFSDGKQAIAFRVIADHIRAIVFTIGDGQLPSNTGAGYVIRRILRRAVRYYFQFLQYKQPLLNQLVSLIALQYEDVFPEIKAQELFIQQVIEEEENSFLKTLAKGLKRIDEIIKQTNTQHCIGGQQVFELYDRYGFPIDLTRLIAQENNLTIDEAAFTIAMNEQKNRSKAAAAQDVSDWIILKEEKQEYNPYTHFSTIKKVDILRYRTIEKNNKHFTQIVTSSLSLYAESG
ncbi:MAG: alanine--tRNA ligase-related protein, partial [Sediminibacterium sp.]|nr:alanine--tRNA ligase-related protein [Sediminibacterium sp.]